MGDTASGTGPRTDLQRLWAGAVPHAEHPLDDGYQGSTLTNGGRTGPPCTPACPRIGTTRRRGRSWPARCGPAGDGEVLHVHRLVFTDQPGGQLWWKSRRVSATLAYSRATLRRAFSRFLPPFCLRALFAWSGELLLRAAETGVVDLPPEERAAKWSARGQRRPPRPPRARLLLDLDDERGEVAARAVFGHRHAGRISGQRARPADLHSPILGNDSRPSVRTWKRPLFVNGTA